MVTDQRSAIRCRHGGPHGSWRLCWPTSRFDGQFVFLCRDCADLIAPLLRPWYETPLDNALAPEVLYL